MRIWIALSAAIGMATLSGCHPARPASASSTIRVASDALFPPFHFVEEDGTVTGHDIELARVVLERAGFKVEIEVVRPYTTLLSGLAEGRYQMVAATTGITPERQQRLLFSKPYFTTCQAIVVRAGDGEPKSRADLAGKQVGAAGAGTSARAVQGMSGVVRVQLHKGVAGIPALERGDIDALVVDEFEAVEAARKSDGQLVVLPEPAALEHYGLVMQRDARALKDQVDRALELLESNGTLARLQREFGIVRDEEWPVKLPD